jgi:hypothetical protein
MGQAAAASNSFIFTHYYNPQGDDKLLARLYNRSDMSPDSPVSTAPAGMGEFSRIFDVFLDPKKAFADIAERPRWVVPLVLVIVVALVYVYLFSQHVGWERFMRQTLETSSRAAQMSAEQREQAIAMQSKFAGIAGYAGVVLGVPITDLIIAGVLLGIANALFSASLRFKQVFAVVCYSGLPGLLFTGLAIAVMFLKNPEDFNLRNPLMFNPGAFMDPATASKFLYSLASSLDLFTLWTMLLMAVGLSAAGRKFSFGSALTAILLPWGVMVLGKAALAGVFS